jgi:hypothetical protein
MKCTLRVIGVLTLALSLATPLSALPAEPGDSSGAEAGAGHDCPTAPRAGTWDFVAGKMKVNGEFTPLGGGSVTAIVDVIACGERIEAAIDTVGTVIFKQLDSTHYSASRLPKGFSAGIKWELTVVSPAELKSMVYFDDPAVHLQAHQWTFVGDASPPDKLRIRQGLWGYVPPGQEIGWFRRDPTGSGLVEPEAYTPPDADGFYQLPFEPGESGWFCMITGPHSDATLMSECVEWSAVEGLKYCGLSGRGWDC